MSPAPQTPQLPAFTSDALSLQDIEAVRLALHGSSVIDWYRLAFTSVEEVDQFLRLNGCDPDLEEDQERLRYLLGQAVEYLRTQFGFLLPPEVADPVQVQDLFLFASRREKRFDRGQILSCVVLKTMHVINHLESRELLHQTSTSEAELLSTAERHLNEIGRQLKERGLPIVRFYGSRKGRASTLTKLLSKRSYTAAEVLDRLRFRIVTESRHQVVPIIAYLLRNVVPFNQVHPDHSTNNLVDLTGWAQRDGRLAPVLEGLQDGLAIDVGATTPPTNEFSGPSYRMINFIVDVPVGLADLKRPTSGYPTASEGQVLYVPVEFQVVDQEAEYWNEQGANSHTEYKARQRDEVRQRLKWGRLSDRPMVPEREPLVDENSGIIRIDPRVWEQEGIYFGAHQPDPSGDERLVGELGDES